MAHSYTPGLKVSEYDIVRRKRILPIKGEVTVKAGDSVEPDTVVARTELPGDVYPVNVANTLGLGAKEVLAAMQKKVGEYVEQGAVLARASSFFGLFKSSVDSPISGTVESISSITGQVILRGAPLPVEVKAYIKGRVKGVFPEEGVEVETPATFIQGIFGVGGETDGELCILTDDSSQKLEAELILPEHKGKVIVGGSMVTAESLKKAVEVGVLGIVAGGIDDRDLRDFLGYDLGVAITGSEELGISLMVTEGFGEIKMADKTFGFLKKNAGKKVSMNGATQVRAGVIRPELVIPCPERSDDGALLAEAPVIEPGGLIRCIRTPYFGQIGRVTALPSALRMMESGTMVRVLEVEFEDGEKAVLPRANVERIEGV